MTKWHKVTCNYPSNGVYYKSRGSQTLFNNKPFTISHTMRKIEEQMNRAIVNKEDWMVNSNSSNTNVNYNSNTNCSTVVLHRTAIAVYDHNTQELKLNTGGYTTNTTKSRLNAILSELITGAKVFQKNFDWYLSYNNQTVDFWDGMILSQGEVI